MTTHLDTGDANPPAEVDPVVAAVRREVCAVYRGLVESVADVFSDESGDPLAVDVELPFDHWERADESSRAVPALVALAHEISDPDPAATRAVTRVLVGLDVLVTALDEFVDTATPHRDERTALATTVALASHLAFSAIPDRERAAAVSAELVAYLVETARIPAVEGTLRERLATADGDPLSVLRSVYAARARDVTAFGAVPALVYGLDPTTTDRLVADLRTHRAHSLLYDDVRDVARDGRDDIETPVRWLLRETDTDPATVAAHLETLYAAFDYSGAPYCESLRALEAAPDDLVTAVAAAGEAF